MTESETEIIQGIRKCSRCSAQEGQIKDFLIIIIIQIQQGEQLCHDCLQQVLQKEQKQIKKIQQRYIYHKEYQSSLSQADVQIYLSKQQDKEHKELSEQILTLTQEDAKANQVLSETLKSCSVLKQRVQTAEQEQQKFWESINRFEKRTFKLQEKSLCAKSQKQLVKNHLDVLTKTSVAHLFFNITIQDSYSQVFGLTIGKKPDQAQLNWDQTNSGIAHLLLGYNYLILKYGLSYTNIEDIKIKGTMSQILLKNKQTYLSICYSKENEKVFGVLLQTLLLQLFLLNQHIQEIENLQYSQDLKLPFQINRKELKILDMFVNPLKLEQKNKWVQWTKAMRYFLINFKHLLTISSLSDPYL